MTDTFYQIEKGIRNGLPGTEVQWEMASSDRRIRNYHRSKRSDTIPGAVMILLYPVDSRLYTLFIQRPVYEGVHSGQISFPGGKMEKYDDSLIKTAIRETCEETGIPETSISIIGTLTPLYISVSNIEVTPVVGYCLERPVFSPDKHEVLHLVESDLNHFLNPATVKERPMTIRGEELLIKYYDYNGNIIWGATAMILNELLVIIKREEITLRK